jgi:hypothetical protein
MDLHKFPMDTIQCLLTFESYNYNHNDVSMVHIYLVNTSEINKKKTQVWNPVPSPVVMFKEIQLPDFYLMNHSIYSTKRVSAHLKTENILERTYIYK